MTEPAQKELVRKYLDWKKVNDRLSRYRHVGQHYSLKALQDCSDKSPYYCHYLAWRLGTWKNETWLSFFDELLKYGSSLPHWDRRIGKEYPSKRYQYQEFFSFLWELQVAKFFSEIKGVSVAWTASGLDIKISSNGKTFYIECYTFTKSFAIELFIEELLTQIHPSIRVLHTPCIRFRLPKDRDVDRFLDETFRPYIESNCVENKIREAEKEYPVLLPTPQGIDNFYIYVEGHDPDKYVPGRLPNAAGPPEDYLAVCFKEAIINKTKQLGRCHPNVLAVNYLLSEDFQMAAKRQDQLNESGISERIPLCDFSDTIDGLFFSACGLDDIPSLQNSYLKIKTGIEHPISSLSHEFHLLAIKGDRFLCH